MVKFLIGLVASIAIAYLAYKGHALNKSGGILAGILGTIVFGLGGGGWAVVLLTFFISSSLLSRLFKTKKSHLDQAFEKGSRRDGWQVTANGGISGALTLLYVVFSKIYPDTIIVNLFWMGFAASLAGANADTWGTEIGVLNPGQPVLLTTFKKVPKGTSGGVSWEGTLAALAGAALVGGAAVLVVYLGWVPVDGFPIGMQFLAITIGGFGGAILDSVLGATLQSIYFCPQCQKETEKHPDHTCGSSTTLVRGVRWLNNDWVNSFCTLSAGILGILLGIVLK